MTLSKRKKSAKRNSYLWIIALVAIFGIYSIIERRSNASSNELAKQESLINKEETTVEENATEDQTSTHSSAQVSGKSWGIPARIKGRKEVFIYHKGYVISYNPNWKTPNWSAWELTYDELNGSVKRTNRFIPDPNITIEQANTDDYKNSGYSRGHMAPAADFKWDEEAMKESFYLTNICPQNQELNSGDWSELENQCRFWAKKDKSLWIVCGPIMDKNPQRIGVHQVAVPKGFFKVILSYSTKDPKMLGFIYPNENLDIPMKNYIKTVDEVEKETGIDFFTVLPDNIENKLESENSTDRWRWPLGKRRLLRPAINKMPLKVFHQTSRGILIRYYRVPFLYRNLI